MSIAPTKNREGGDPNVSPVGWYLASYQLRFTELGGSQDNDPSARFLVWENTILVKADDISHAYEKAVEAAALETDPYQSGPDGASVQWVFEGITELLPIYESLEDGAEIMWSERDGESLRDIQGRAKTKAELCQ